ncbi:4514_t:CDS:2 [Paraglomus brasilianum]|uniref:4514_t:CDS:1 n=1 Tax=Paraglomus brasilianum TaxID=144538 RepID=A0A9N9D1Z6_9GLOM|nr:4514_t:CDS:2 [Paraglomus brasilianum]
MPSKEPRKRKQSIDDTRSCYSDTEYEWQEGEYCEEVPKPTATVTTSQTVKLRQKPQSQSPPSLNNTIDQEIRSRAVRRKYPNIALIPQVTMDPPATKSPEIMMLALVLDSLTNVRPVVVRILRWIN